MAYLCSLAELKTELKTDDTNNDAALLAVIKTASQRIEAYKATVFEPVIETKRFNARGQHITDKGRTLALPPYLVLTTITLGDTTTVDTATELIEYDPPHNALTLTNASGKLWTQYTNDYQRAIAINAVWGYYDPLYASSWRTGSTVNHVGGYTSSSTSIVVTAGTPFSPGQLIRFGTGYDFARVVTVTTNTLTVERGANGGTAASIGDTTAVTIWQPFELVRHACQRWAAYVFRRLGAYEAVVYDGLTTTTFPRDMPGDVQGDLDSFYRLFEWSAV